MNEQEARELLERTPRATQAPVLPEVSILIDKELRHGIAAQLRALANLLETPEARQ